MACPRKKERCGRWIVCGKCTVCCRSDLTIRREMFPLNMTPRGLRNRTSLLCCVRPESISSLESERHDTERFVSHLLTPTFLLWRVYFMSLSIHRHEYGFVCRQAGAVLRTHGDLGHEEASNQDK